MRILSRLIKLLFFILIFQSQNSLAGNIQTTDQAEVKLTLGKNINGEVQALVEFKLKEHWKIYWKNPGDSGFPIQIKVTNPTTSNLQILWPTPKRAIDVFGDIKSESYVYYDYAALPIIIKGLDPIKTKQIEFNIKYGVCNEVCIPNEANFTLDTPNNYSNPEITHNIERASSLIPQKNGFNKLYIDQVKFINIDSKQPYLKLYAHKDEKFNNPDLFLDGHGLINSSQPKITFLNDKHKVIFVAPLKILGTVADLKDLNLDLVVTNDNYSVEKNITNKDIIYENKNSVIKTSTLKTKPANLSYIIILSLIGGLILNLMPCTLPVLSIKILSVVKNNRQDRTEITKSFLASSLGIIFSFLSLALILALLKSLGQTIGWGFHFQEPLFLAILAIITIFFALNLWGIFEINTLNIVNNLSAKSSNSTATSNNKFLNNFLTGCLATLLATPCTAPFLGTAAGFAVSQKIPVMIYIFVSMGFGMALPYLLLAIFPKCTNILPKPGRWMLILKKIMAIFLFITAIWLIWVISFQWGNLSAFTILGFSLITIISSNFEIEHKKITLIILLIIGLSCGYINQNKAIKMLPNETNWHKFSEQKIAEYNAQGKIVFVDITAAWCLTCKANKLITLNDPEIKKLLSADNIILMRGDWTNKDDKITKYLQKNQRAGVPFNKVYLTNGQGEIILPELLTKDSIKKALKSLR